MILVDKFAQETVPIENIRRLPANLAKDFFTKLSFVRGITKENCSLALEKIKARSNIVVNSVTYDVEKNSSALSFKFLEE